MPTPTEPALPPPPAPAPVAVPTGPVAPLYYRLPTTQPVVFIRVDDGWVRDPGAVAALRQYHLAISAFLVEQAADADTSYFAALEGAGATIEDHTYSHPMLTRLSYPAQVAQICRPAARYAAVFGRRPTLLGPPYGAVDLAVRRAARACGMAAVVQWSATMIDGHLSAVGGRLRPGDIILLHFDPTLGRDLRTLAGDLADEGLSVGRLEDYIT